MGHRNTSLLSLQSQVIKGHPLSGSHKKMGYQTCVEAPLWEVLVFCGAWQREIAKMLPVGWTKAEGQYNDGI